MRYPSRLTRFALATAVVGLLAVAPAFADADLALGNGDRVELTIGADQPAVVRAAIPAGAKVIVDVSSVRGDLDVVVTPELPGDPEVRRRTRPRSESIAFVAAETGEHSIAIDAGATGGDVQVRVRWKAPRRLRVKGELALGETTLRLGVDAGATVKAKAKAARKSGAVPRITALRTDETILFADGPGKRASSAAGPVVVDDTADLLMDVRNEGEVGRATLSLAGRSPRRKRARLELTREVLGPPQSVRGELTRVGSQLLLNAPGDGASVRVPADALPAGTAVALGSATALDVPAAGLEAVTLPIHVAPVDARPSAPVSVSVVVDPGDLADGLSGVVLMRRDERGRQTQLLTPLALEDGRLVFTTTQLGSFQAFSPTPPEPVTGDFDGDGRAEWFVQHEQRGMNPRWLISGAQTSGEQTLPTGLTLQPTLEVWWGDRHGIGDFNGDGLADMAVFGEHLEPESPGAVRMEPFVDVRVFLGRRGQGLDPSTESVRFEPLIRQDGSGGVNGGPPTNDLTAGDIDGDGRAEAVWGGIEQDPFDDWLGVVTIGWVGLGDTTQISRITTPKDDNQNKVVRFGSTLLVRDLDGDGLGEVIVTWRSTFEEFGPHEVYVFRGVDVATRNDLTTADAAFVIRADDGADLISSRFGFHVAAGDLDADGFGELVIGDAAWQRDPIGDPRVRDGRVLVYRSLGARLTSARQDGVTDVLGIDDAHEIQGIGDASSDIFQFGAKVEIADVTGDGVVDLIANGRDPLVESDVRIFRGRSGFAPPSDEHFDIRISDERAGGNLSYLSGTPDVNGDGVADIVVADPAWRLPDGSGPGGRVYVIPGGSTLADGRVDELALGIVQGDADTVTRVGRWD